MAMVPSFLDKDKDKQFQSQDPEMQSYIDLYNKFSSDLPKEDQGLDQAGVDKFRETTGDQGAVFRQNLDPQTGYETGKFRSVGAQDPQGQASMDKGEPGIQIGEQDNALKMARGMAGMDPEPQMGLPKPPQPEPEMQPSVLPPTPQVAQSPEGTKMPILDFGKSINTVDNLQDAQNAENNSVFGNQLMKAMEYIGAGAIGSGVRPNTEMFDQNIKDAGRVTAQFKDRAAQEMNDPASGVSKAFSEFAKQYGIDVQGASAKHISELYPYLFKGFEASEARKATKDNLKYKYDELKALKEIAGQKKAEEANATAMVKMGSDLDPNKLARGNLAQTQANLNRIDRLEGLIYDGINGKLDKTKIKDLTPQETKEVAIGVATVLTGNNAAAQSTIKGLSIDTLRGRIMEGIQFMSNDPTGTKQQAFTKRFGKLMARERGIITKQLTDAQLKKAFGTHSKLKDTDPDAFYNALSEHTQIPREYLEAYANLPVKEKAEATNELAVTKYDPEYVPSFMQKKAQAGKPEMQKAAAPKEESQSSELIKVKAPNGKIHLVPQSKLKAALDAGGKRV